MDTTADTEDSEMTDEPSAAATLDAIRRGGGNVLIMVRQRMNEATTELDAGAFEGAIARLHEALHMLGPLAAAQAHLGIAHTGRVVRARDLEVGMELTQVGKVAEVHAANCTHDTCPGHYLVTIGENPPFVLDGDAEVYVEVETNG